VSKVIQHTKSIPITRLAQVLGINEDLLWEKILDLAEKYQFKIDKEEIIFPDYQDTELVQSLNEDLKSWLLNQCKECGFVNKAGIKICEKCGTGLTR